MEISFAAYAAIMCILMVDIAQQESDVRLEIMKRSTQLKYYFYWSGKNRDLITLFLTVWK